MSSSMSSPSLVLLLSNIARTCLTVSSVSALNEDFLSSKSFSISANVAFSVDSASSIAFRFVKTFLTTSAVTVELFLTSAHSLASEIKLSVQLQSKINLFPQ